MLYYRLLIDDKITEYKTHFLNLQNDRLLDHKIRDTHSEPRAFQEAINKTDRRRKRIHSRATFIRGRGNGGDKADSKHSLARGRSDDEETDTD